MTEQMTKVPPLASPAHRLGALAVDAGLMLATCIIGWIVWNLILWGKGQTPGKNILKIRVLNEPTGTPATWGQMFIRQFLIGQAIAIPYTVASIFLQVKPNLPGLIGFFACLALLLVWTIVDIVWVFGPTHRRLTDYWSGTIVVNEANLNLTAR